MIVCLCKGVSDTKILSVIDQGAETVEAVGIATGAGTDCGGCQGAIARMLAGEPAAPGCRHRRLPMAAERAA